MLFTVSREGRTAEIFLTQGKQLTALEPYRGTKVSDTVMLRYSTLKPIHHVCDREFGWNHGS
ncbi:hypothetical protein P9D84_05745 [Bacillus vallismortis]|uniref:hypothetical protein n=1 Tax=Bacillus vallismortis TaxID=72361 RepID=UPI002DB86900|nr:hypothetical protein [Bacillus vallismortis]MEC1790908.1 hypothetical protein [Bacillus vallismortis]